MSNAVSFIPRKIGRALALYLLALTILLIVYNLTLLRHVAGGFINGMLTPYMDDVGEIQVALNVWGTIHHTGYPLFAILGNGFVSVARAVGVHPATAPVLFSMACGLAGLTVFYYLIYRLTRSAELAAGAMLLLGLARTIWAHHVIAEVYSLSLTFSIILLALALLPLGGINLRTRVFLLALAGGFGVAHHRLIALLAPGLLLAVYWWARGTLRSVDDERSVPMRKPLRWWVVTFAATIPIGLIGFIPYVYLPLRAQAGAAWVYGDPSTPAGLWHEFTGAEAAFLMQVPTLQGALNDTADTLRIIGDELTSGIAILALLLTIGALAGRGSVVRRQVGVALTCVVGPLLFLVFQHRVVMPEATAMPVIMALVFGAAIGMPAVIRERFTARRLLLLISGLAAFQVIAHWGFVRGLTTDQTGVYMIAMATRIPREGGRTVLMLPWGPNYTAVAYSKYVTGENADLNIVTHKADLKAVAAHGDSLYTARDVFYRFPLHWWDGQLGRVFLSSPAEGVVAIRTAPLTAPPTQTSIPVKYGVVMRNTSMCLDGTTIRLTVTWGAAETPTTDLSTLVHLVGEGSPEPLATADSSAPVYGWYPTSRWSPGEVIYDSYVLPVLDGAAYIVVGMYERSADGAFVNYGVTRLPLVFAQPCPR